MSQAKSESKRRFRIERLEERIAPTSCCCSWGGSKHGSGKHSGKGSGKHSGKGSGKHSGKHSGKGSGKYSGKHSGRGGCH